MSDPLAQSSPTVSWAAGIPQLVVETAEHEMAAGRRLGRPGLLLISARKTGEPRACLEAALAREAARRGGQSDQ